MKVTVYDKDTGKFLAFGQESNSKIQRLIRAGHSRREGRFGNNTKLVNELVVTDNSRETSRSDRSQSLRDASEWIKQTDSLLINGQLDATLTEQFFQNIKTIYNP